MKFPDTDMRTITILISVLFTLLHNVFKLMVMIRIKEKICKICHPRQSLALGVLLYWLHPDVCTRCVAFWFISSSLPLQQGAGTVQSVHYVMGCKTVQLLAEEKDFSSPHHPTDSGTDQASYPVDTRDYISIG
jgi:hypothetical protein